MRVTTDLGEIVKKLRNERGLSRGELAERAGVSVSHLEKIETGLRKPGINTFLKIMLELDVNISLHGTNGTVQENCILAIQDVFAGCSDGEAKYLACMVKSMAENFTLMV